MTGAERIAAVFEGDQKALSVFLTAGFPAQRSAVELVPVLEKSGVDFIELGIPFSDPIADGEVIQHSSEVAIENGMCLELLFEQVSEIRKVSAIPILLMGYLNPILQYGVARFVDQCVATGVDGLILPDVPLIEYDRAWKAHVQESGLGFVFLVTPQTKSSRLQEIKSRANAFIYAVSSNAITGADVRERNASRLEYYKSLQTLQSTVPVVVGFGIQSRQDFEEASEYLNGAIIGSAFLRYVERAHVDGSDICDAAVSFVEGILSPTK